VPFYTTKSKGTGLGLAVCKKLMKEAGGDVTVTSRLGEGSTFTLFFPRLPAKPAAASTT
jgi:signal transduction histidine kinase